MANLSKYNSHQAQEIRDQLADPAVNSPSIQRDGDILVVPDTQVRAGTPVDHIEALARYIIKHKPQTIVHIGDAWDFASLSTYATRKEQEGNRLIDDMEAGNEAMAIIPKAIRAHNLKAKGKVYKPLLVFTSGNHENRLTRYTNERAELTGIIDLQKHVERAGWVYLPFLQPIYINGVMFCHYLPNAMSGRPLGGTPETKLNKTPTSFVHGHQQQLQYARRQTFDGSPHFGVVAGAFYQHDEDYRGAANTEWRGFVELKAFTNRYGKRDYDMNPCGLERLMADYPAPGKKRRKRAKK